MFLSDGVVAVAQAVGVGAAVEEAVSHYTEPTFLACQILKFL